MARRDRRLWAWRAGIGSKALRGVGEPWRWSFRARPRLRHHAVIVLDLSQLHEKSTHAKPGHLALASVVEVGIRYRMLLCILLGARQDHFEHVGSRAPARQQFGEHGRTISHPAQLSSESHAQVIEGVQEPRGRDTTPLESRVLRAAVAEEPPRPFGLWGHCHVEAARIRAPSG